MTAPDIRDVSLWLQTRHGMHLFLADHPSLPECIGAHRPDQPCNGKRGKHPVGRWSRDSTNNPAELLAALSHGPRNLGADCGASGLLVVDEDRPGAFAQYAAEIGKSVPDTFTVSTARGRHLYFRQPDGVRLGNSQGALAGRGIDIRGNGGYVIAPGSMHASGRLYAPVDSSAPILPAPRWLVAALRTRVEAPPIRWAGEVADLTAYTQAALQGETTRVREAPKGDRNQMLNKAAYNLGRLVGSGALPEELAARELYQAASVHFGPTDDDMTPGEARATIRSGMTAGMRRPRSITTRTSR